MEELLILFCNLVILRISNAVVLLALVGLDIPLGFVNVSYLDC